MSQLKQRKKIRINPINIRIPFLTNYIFESENKLVQSDKLILQKDSKNESVKLKTIIFRKLKNNNLIAHLILIMYLFFQFSLGISLISINLKFSNITLKTKGGTTQYIFGHVDGNIFNPNNYPNKIYIDGNESTNVENSYTVNAGEHTFELIWNKTITDCSSMFADCEDIIEIDFSNFNTSEVSFMPQMFRDCSSLKSINFRNFNTSKTIYMGYMFYNCSSLESLDLSMFDTKELLSMRFLFDGCSSLISLNLSNFDTSLVTWMHNLFNDCKSLAYINLLNFNEKTLDNNTEYYEKMFNNVPNNVVICVNENNIQNKIFPQIMNITCVTLDCSYNWKLNQKRILDNPINGCQCEFNKCLSCSDLIKNKRLCTQCNDNYYAIEKDDSNNIDQYINCYQEIKGYYLDKKDSVFKKCYFTCDKCQKKGDIINHNCVSCNENYSYIIISNNYSNCYQNCDFYYYFDDVNNYFCTDDRSCPKGYYLLAQDKKECKKYDINDEIYNILKNGTNEIEYYDLILKKIEHYFISDNYDSTNLENGNDELIQIEKISVILTTNENQMRNLNNTDNNFSLINLGKCEMILREKYNLSNNSLLYIKKIDIFQPGMKIAKVEYSIYIKLFEDKLEKLNLSYCHKSQVSLIIPIIISENLDKLNTSSGYYNDLCYTTTSESGTDISLKDRKNEFIEII